MTANPNKALWEKGDFTRIAESMRESGEALVKSFGIKKGLRVLDLGCGDGTTALPEAKLGADVVGIDIARKPRRGREQAGGGAGPGELQGPGRRCPRSARAAGADPRSPPEHLRRGVSAQT